VEVIKVIYRSKAMLWRTNEGYHEVGSINEGHSGRSGSQEWKGDMSRSWDKECRSLIFYSYPFSLRK
jgi:hypothetical protein